MLKLGIIQLSIQEGNIEKNCAHIEELVRNHSSDDIDLAFRNFVSADTILKRP